MLQKTSLYTVQNQVFVEWAGNEWMGVKKKVCEELPGVCLKEQGTKQKRPEQREKEMD